MGNVEFNSGRIFSFLGKKMLVSIGGTNAKMGGRLGWKYLRVELNRKCHARAPALHFQKKKFGLCGSAGSSFLFLSTPTTFSHLHSSTPHTTTTLL
jgi:hypothetical protein